MHSLITDEKTCAQETHFLDVGSFSGIYFPSQHELAWPVVWPRQLWVTVPAGVGCSALLKNITWKNLVATSENLSSRDLCYSMQRRWGIGCFYPKTVVKCVYNHTGAAHLFPEVIIQVSGEFQCSASEDELAQTIPSFDTNTKKLLVLFFLFFSFIDGLFLSNPRGKTWLEQFSTELVVFNRIALLMTRENPSKN